MFAPTTRILVVDDNIGMRATLKNMLKQLGFENMVEAVDGLHAMQVLETEGNIELVLSDHNMPKCSGLEFFMQMLENPKFKNLPFMMITADSERPVIMKALDMGAVGFVTKPVTLDQLRAKLEAAYQRFVIVDAARK